MLEKTKLFLLFSSRVHEDISLEGKEFLHTDGAAWYCCNGAVIIVPAQECHDVRGKRKWWTAWWKRVDLWKK